MSIRARWIRQKFSNDCEVPPNLCKTAVTQVDKFVYVIGGRDGHFCSKNIWKFNCAKETWSKLKINGELLLEGHCAVSYKENIYILGGGFKLSFSVLQLSTSHENVTANIVKSFYDFPNLKGHTAVLYGSDAYIFGGFNDVRGPNSTFKLLSLDSYRLRDVPDANRPPSRNYHSAVVFDNTMWLYGGVQSSGPTNDLWTFSFKTQSWAMITTKVSPGAFYGHSCFVNGSQMFVFGGCTVNSLLNQLWRFNFCTYEWLKICSVDSTPSPRAFVSLIPLTTSSHASNDNGFIKTTFTSDVSTFNLRSTGLSDVEEFSMTAIETVERRCSNISFQQQYSQALNCLSIPGQIENQIETFVEMKPLRSPVKIPLTITPPVPQAEIREKKSSVVCFLLLGGIAENTKQLRAYMNEDIWICKME